MKDYGLKHYLSATAVPTQAFTSLSTGEVLSSLSNDEFYVFQRVIPAQVVFPLSLVLAFAALVAICVVSLWIMAIVTLRPYITDIAHQRGLIYRNRHGSLTMILIRDNMFDEPL